MTNPFVSSVDENYNPFIQQDEYTTPSFQGQNHEENDTTLPPTSNYTHYSPPPQPVSTPIQEPLNPTPAPTTQKGTGFFGTGVYKDPVTGISYSEKDFDKREKALQQKEAELSRLEQNVANGTYEKPKSRKNFPPLIKIWEYYPNEDLPAAVVPLMQRIKWILLAVCLLFVVNSFCCLCCLSNGAGKAVEPGTLIVFSTIYLIVFCPLSFECCFFVLYGGLKHGKAMRFFCGVLGYIVWFIFVVLNIVGISNSGSVGFITMIDLFGSDAKWVGAISLIFCIGGVGVAVLMAFGFLGLVKYWKSVGLERKAFGEASVMAANYAKEHPEVAQTAVTAALNQQNQV